MKSVSVLINGTTMVLNVIGTLIIIGLVALISADVIWRGVFNSPISGVPELVSMSIVAIVFLQAAHTFKMGRFTRSDAVLNMIEKRSLRARTAIEIVFGLVSIFIIGILFTASIPFFTKALRKGTFVGNVGDFIAPAWPVKLIILIGCFALLLQMALFVVRQVSIFVTGHKLTSDEIEGLN